MHSLLVHAVFEYGGAWGLSWAAQSRMHSSVQFSSMNIHAYCV